MRNPNPEPAAPGRESVWDYPRPPRVEADGRRVVVRFNDHVIADTTSSHRVLETSHPPVFYIPPEDVRIEYLRASQKQTWCEFKGDAHYYDIEVDGKSVASAAWCYPQPMQEFTQIQHAIAFYPGMMDSCTVDGEEVQRQDGDFYGGWITSEIAGPFKGAPGTNHW